MSEEWTEERIEEIEKYCEAATTGPWDARTNEIVSASYVNVISAAIEYDDPSICWSDPDRVFITKSRTDLPAAMEELRRRGEEIETYQKLVALYEKDVVLHEAAIKLLKVSRDEIKRLQGDVDLRDTLIDIVKRH